MEQRDGNNGSAAHRFVRGTRRRRAVAILAVAAVALVGAPVLLNSAHAATTFTVNSILDDPDVVPGDGVCETAPGNGVCTLRAAIEEANNFVGTDTINFNIPGGGVQTISLGSSLPNVTEALTIDGASQPGASCAAWPPTLTVVLSQTAGGRLLQSTAALTARGLVVNEGGAGTDATIALGSNSHLECNFIGTNVAGTSTALGVPGPANGAAVVVVGNGTVIGGPLPSQGNLIADEVNRQITLIGDSNVVQSNHIGVAPTGAAIVPNPGTQWQDGVFVLGSNNLIGGAAAGQGNVIANMSSGDGVNVSSGTGNTIVGNSIYNNSTRGITLGDANTEDAGDPDTGANNKQNSPVISSALVATGVLTLNYSIDSTIANSAYPVNIDFYKTDGVTNQGKTYFHRATVAAPGSVNEGALDAATLGVSLGDSIVATATDNAGNTSQFSVAQTVTSGATAQFVVNSTLDTGDVNPGNNVCETAPGNGICTLRAAIEEANARVGDDTVAFAILPADSTVKTIGLTSALPDITDNLTIQGEGQSGASCAAPFAPKILVNGNNVPGTILHATTGRLLANALIINRGAGGSTATIILSSNANVLQCMFFGTDETGSATQTGVAGSPNGAALRLEGSNNNIGGVVANQRNVFGDATGIQIEIAAGSNNNALHGNSIGVSPTGTAITHPGNWSEGIYVKGDNNIIGGTVAGEGNVIANINSGEGVWVDAGTGNRVIGNSTYANSTFGIKIDNGTNEDAGDPDTGANNKQNAPVLGAITIGGGPLLTLNYSIDSISPDSVYPITIEFYKTDGTNDQGKTFFYQATKSGGPGSGSVGSLNPVALGVNLGESIVATATDANGNTSQFSVPVAVSIAPASGVYVVNSTADTGDANPGNGICLTSGGVCTLRAAIEEANAHAGPDTINFNIPLAGVQTISPSGVLVVNETVTIDGYTQPGAIVNSSVVGSNAVLNIELTKTLQFTAGAGGSTVRGLVINGAGTSLQFLNNSNGNTIAGNYIGTNPSGTVGVAGSGGLGLVGSSNNIIGGPAPADRNLISGNGNGIKAVTGSNNNRIIGNYIGTNAAGTAAVPNGTGIALTDGAGNEVGWTGAGEGNLISGNDYGITATNNGVNPGEANLKIHGNFIGTTASGNTALPNTRPIFIGASTGIAGLRIGDGTVAGRNVIAGNSGTGIDLYQHVNGALIQGNYIGVGADGTTPLGNTAKGIDIVNGNGNVIGGVAATEGNRIAHFAQGIQIDTGTGNSVRGNSISDTTTGIDLTPGAGINFNHDPASAATVQGGNNYQNYPLINGATFDGSKTRVIGTLVSTPSHAHEIDVFVNPTCNVSSFGDGLTFLGTVNVTTDAAGKASFDTEITGGLGEPAGLTTTATDTVTGDTSEFSYCRAVSTTNLTWVAAQNVGNGAVTSQFITDRLQEKWFKVPVSPGAKVKVTLDGPAGSAVSLHSDPTGLYNELTNPVSAVALSAESADFAFLPSGYLPSGYLPSGYLPSGYLPSGYLPSGYLADGSLPSGYLPSGYLPSGYLPSGYLPSGYLPSGYLPSGYLPSGYLPSGYLPSGYLPSGYLPSGYLPSGYLPSGYLADPYANAARRSLLGISADPAATTQTIERNSFSTTGDMYVRVVGPYDLTRAFSVRIEVNGGVCGGVAPVQGPLPAHVTGNPQTVIVIDSSRLPGTPTEKAAALQSLATLAGLPDVNGVVVDLATGVYPRVSNARTQADQNKACPAAQNLLAAEIKNVIDSYRTTSLKYVVLAGGTDAIPFHQVQDVGGLANEKDYVPPVNPLSAAEGALRSGMVSGQDFYGASTTLDIGGRSISVPGLAVGRLVDTATDISAAVAQYVASGGVVAPQSALVTGYDFVGDTAQTVVSDLAPGGGIATDTLIQNPGEKPSAPSAWDATQLRTKLLAGNHNLIMLSGHFSAGNLLAADYKTSLSAGEIQTATTDLRNTVIVALGCHGGYSITDADLTADSSPDPDWAKAFLRKGSAAYIAATGYAYGDTEVMEYGERLVINLERSMRTGNGPVPIGEALVNAKQTYLASTPELTGLDEKTVVAMTLFGLPMMKINMPANNRIGTGSVSIIGATSDVTSGPGVAATLATADSSIGSQIAPHTTDLVNLATNTNVTTTYYSGKDGVVARPFEPLLPKEINDVTVPNKVLRGVAMLGGSYLDQTVTPLTSAVSTETSTINSSYNTDVFYPNQTWTTNYYDAVSGGPTRLITVPAQYRSTSTGSIDGTMRTFTSMNLRFYYLPATWTSGSPTVRAAALSPAPLVYGASAEKTNGSITFNVNARTDGTAGTQAVWVLYTATAGPLFGTWAKLDLTQSPSDPNSWTKTAAIDAATPAANIRFMVQAVNGAGVPTLETNLGKYYVPTDTTLPAPPAAVATSLAMTTVPASIPYLKSGTFSATLTSTGTASLAGRTIVFNIGGQQVAGVTNASGVATVSVAPVISTGQGYSVSATFRGDAGLVVSNATSVPFRVDRDSTSLVLTPATTSVALGAPTTIKAALRDSSNGPLGSKSVVFVIRDAAGATVQTKSVIADLYGNATLGSVTAGAGAYTVQAYFAGGPLSVPDDNYVGATSTAVDLVVEAPVAATISAAATNADNSVYLADSWTRQDVTIHYTCSVATCPPDQVVTAEGVTEVGPVSVTAPNTPPASVTFGKVKIDRTPPTVTLTAPTNGAVYTLGSTVNAAFSCADTASGTPTCTGTVANGQSLTATAGPKTFTVNAVDGAGNTASTTVNYTVAPSAAAAPVVLADYGVPGLEAIGFPSNVVLVSGSFTDSDSSRNFTASVRWTPTSTFSPMIINSNSRFLSAHIYPTAGTYTVTVKVCDSDGNCGTDDVSIRSGVSQKVVSVLECVTDTRSPGNSRYRARFGYNNAAPVALYVPFLPPLENSFSSFPFDQGQPTVFLPGAHSNVVTATFSGTVSWRLMNTTVTAKKTSPAC